MYGSVASLPCCNRQHGIKFASFLGNPFGVEPGACRE
jgi:hypothetical protein